MAMNGRFGSPRFALYTKNKQEKGRIYRMYYRIGNGFPLNGAGRGRSCWRALTPTARELSVSSGVDACVPSS